MTNYQIPKGLFDILPYGEKEEWKLTSAWQYIEKILHRLAADYGFQEIRTPIFEHAELFQRGVGDTSDIVTKEMYTFEDKGGRTLCLRPEGTSSVMRAFVENKLYSLGGVHKLYYIGPMFRYERPQAGRYRQHHQFGIEFLGAKSYEADAETIDLFYSLCQRLGIKNITVMLNSIGDLAARDAFRKALKEFLSSHHSKLSEDSKVRFEKNPLRILDSKDPEDQKLLVGAPSILDFLSPDDKKHFDSLCRCLDAIKIPYQINPKIVRGLDYYNRTVFEVVSYDLGSQNAIGGGGRYDGFTSVFGGPSLPGIGFAAGMERLLQTMWKQGAHFPIESVPFVFFIPLGEEAKMLSLTLTTEMRRHHISADLDLEAKKIAQGLQRADKVKARFAIILGSDEIQNGKVKLKDMAKREEEEIPLKDLITTIQNKWNQRW